MRAKIIIAEYRADVPDAGYPEGSKIPWVVHSTHPRFDAGARFDYGFLQIALSEGYSVYLVQP